MDPRAKRNVWELEYISQNSKLIFQKDQLAVYTAEIVAVIIALQWVEEVRQGGIMHRLLSFHKKHTVDGI